MSYTTVPTFTTGQLVLASDFNTYIRDNLAYLSAARQIVALYWRNSGSNYATSSTSFTSVDTTNLRLTLPATVSGRVKVTVNGVCSVPSSTVEFRISRDAGAEFSGDATHGDIASSSTVAIPFAFVAYFTGLTLLSHTFDLQYRMVAAVSGGINNAGSGVHMMAEEY